MSDVRISVDQATAIITEAKNDGSYLDPMPVDEHERIKEAMSLYTKARDAARTGVRIPAVLQIVAIVEGESPAGPETPPFDVAEPAHEPEMVVESPAEELVQDQADTPDHQEPEPVEDFAEEEKPRVSVSVNDLDFSYEEKPSEEDVVVSEPPAREQISEKPAHGAMPIDDFFAKERLPIPANPDWELTQVPGDVTTLSDAQVRRMHSEYNAYFSRAAWLLAQEENDLHAAEHFYEQALGLAIRKEAKTDKQITAAKAAAAIAPEVLECKERVMAHAASVKKLKALVAIYDATCNRLSREWTMRSDERGNSGNLYTR